MHDFAKDDLLRWFPELKDYIRITLLEATGEILTQFDKELSGYALKHFERSGIDVRTNAFVKQVEEEKVILSDGEALHCGLIVWSTGIGPTALVDGLDVPKTRQSRIETDAFFCVIGHSDVFAIGDCAQVRDHELPPTAQVAQQEGTALAKQLNARARGKEPEAFTYRHMGMMAYIGRKRALADMRKIQSKGRGTWLLWRSAYLTKLVSFKNKILVLGDWIHTWIFGRDISRF